ncbi:MAG: type III polyketide synthase [Phycisphaerae bacterium]|nr:type III polyketide synthase [Phycisphaerae bacterium]
MSGTRAAIVGLGCAAPEERRAQDEALAWSMAVAPPADEDARRRAEAIYRGSGVSRRGVASEGRDSSGTPAPDPLRMFPPATDAAPRGPSTAERMRAYARRSAPLSERSAGLALADAGERPGAITHLVTASCTGFAAPGWDLGLIDRLALPPDVLRTHLGFMGCHAAINALRVAEAFTRADGAARVLVCCTEVCSIHFQYDAKPDRVVANALFADGSASAVVAASAGGVARIGPSASLVLAASRSQMAWTIGDHGFEMSLGPELPETIRARAGPWLGAWLDRAGVGLAGVRAWAVHPGGPRVLAAVGEALTLPRAALAASRQVLAEHGNMSSPTVLFILDRLRREAGGPALPAAMVSFGPGVAAEAMLLR